MKCKTIITALEEMSPLSYAKSWDNSGLILGRADKEVTRILIALDATEEVVYQAAAHEVDMLITHHPMIFTPLKKITSDHFIGKKVIKLIQNDISYYAMHTNFDIMGMAEAAANMLSLTNQKVLDETSREQLYKLAVYVPEESAGRVRTAMGKEGAGFIGKYSNCSFNINGIGMFQPLEGTNPYIGSPMAMVNTPEVKIETVVEQSRLKQVVDAMLKVHPYEEVAYDIYELENSGKIQGIGRYGYLPEDISLRQLAKVVKESFGLQQVRIVGDLDTRVLNIAISTGSGKSGISHALSKKCDVLVTGDVDHHSGLDAVEQGLCIIDAGHFGTEHFMKDFLKKYLYDYFTKSNSIYHNNFDEIKIFTAQEQDPFQII